jgi:hypothetical protein
LATCLTSCSGGYSFTGGSIGAAKTLSVDFFANQAPLVNPNLSQEITEAIKDIFLQQTKLKITDQESDMHIEGSITGYEVRPMSAQGNETTSQSRFTITINVRFTNNLEPDKNYSQKFSRFRDYSSDLLFADVENQLVGEIKKELAEDVLNRAIANW